MSLLDKICLSLMITVNTFLLLRIIDMLEALK